MIDPDDVGRWEGDTFIFNEPFDLGEGRVAKRISIGPNALGPGITRDDAIHAFINGVQDPLPSDDDLN